MRKSRIRKCICLTNVGADSPSSKVNYDVLSYLVVRNTALRKTAKLVRNSLRAAIAGEKIIKSGAITVAKDHKNCSMSSLLNSTNLVKFS